MNLRDTTRDLIAQVEQQIGYMIEVVSDPVLATMSTVTMAGRRTQPAHVTRYNPDYEYILDYLICFPVRDRFTLLSEPARGARRDHQRAGRRGGHPAPAGSPADRVRPYPPGVDLDRAAGPRRGITHLRSVPIGLCVSAWLADEYPELQGLQRVYVDNELKVNGDSLRPDVQATV